MKDAMLQSEELPLPGVIDDDQWQAAFDQHDVAFGNDEDSIYTPSTLHLHSGCHALGFGLAGFFQRRESELQSSSGLYRIVVGDAWQNSLQDQHGSLLSSSVKDPFFLCSPCLRVYLFTFEGCRQQPYHSWQKLS